MAYRFREIEPFIVRCTPAGSETSAAERELRTFLKHFRGKLLLDFRCLAPGIARQLIYRVRRYLPQTAVIGVEAPLISLDDLKGRDFYRHEIAFFIDEEDALIWLRGGGGSALVDRVRQWALDRENAEVSAATL